MKCAALGLKHLHVLGQSWGTVLMLLYLLQEKPEDIASVVISSGLSSAKRWIKEAPEFKALLPIEMQL
jgi:proline iminopeptidase